jgi:hypothetical protein
MNTELKTELVAVFKEQIARSINFQFQNLLEKFGNTFSGVYNSRAYSVWKETIRPCTDRLGCKMSDPIVLNEEKVASFSLAQAELFADDLIAKINAKAGELTDAKTIRVSNANFVITGKKGDKQVTIEQNQIINVSVKGKLFNQYPARIYVNGKFTSAAAFNRM